MKKRILATMLVLPLLVAFVAFGFTKIISITVAQLPEDIVLEYDQVDAIEFNNQTEAIELKGYVIPQSSGEELVWTSSNEDIAKIQGNKIIYVTDGEVTITASLKDGSMSKSFKAYIVLAGDTPKYVKANYKYPVEKGENIVGLYDYANSLNSEQMVAHTEIINVSVIPSMASQSVSVSITPECEYRIENSQIFVSPTSAGVHNVKIQSEENSDVVIETQFEAKDAVNIYSYEDIVRVTDYNSSSKTAMSLRVNLESKSNLERTNSMPMEYASGAPHHEYYSQRSTYDIKYIENENAVNGKSKTTNVLAILVFKGDVYGNGHTINLHDHAYPSEEIEGVAVPGPNDVFAGEPLEFVTAVGQLTVFGQGNRGFLINEDGITVDNIVLKNCNNVDNLTNLDYVGTVLEVDGDNVTIKNSTVQNGRTVVRSFSNENLVIENCLLAYAREFIYKQGSNQFVRPDQELAWANAKSQLFTYASLPQEAKDGDSTATIKDTDFYMSGIFCIGMDTHFAGSLLHKFDSTVYNLAATSYKSTLNLEGDVNFYDWKIAKNMDSSTLIKGSMEGLSLNMYTLLKNYDKAYGDGSIIKNIKGIEYVHGGIAFFGGGYNLSEVYLNGARVKSWKDDNYDGLNNDQYISLRVLLNDDKIFDSLAVSVFPRAAGEGYFSFCIYRNTYNGIGVEDTPFN